MNPDEFSAFHLRKFLLKLKELLAYCEQKLCTKISFNLKQNSNCKECKEKENKV